MKHYKAEDFLKEKLKSFYSWLARMPHPYTGKTITIDSAEHIVKEYKGSMEIKEHKETEMPFCEKCGWAGDDLTNLQSEEQAHFEVCPDCKAQIVWIKK